MKKHSNLLAVAVLMTACVNAFGAVKITVQPWGKDPTGTPVELYTLREGNTEVQLTTYGARIVSIRVPDRQGQVGNVVLGFPSLDGYLEARNSFMGATIGRFANRIAGGEFHLDGKTYQIPKNNNENALHGGTVGFDKKVWSSKQTRDGVVMSLVSPDGDMGFPGKLQVSVTFTLSRKPNAVALTIAYAAKTDRATVINFTNHAYFNLANDPSTPVYDDIARLEADRYTPFDAQSIPKGALEPVEGTPYDFRKAHAISTSIPDRGYDMNFALRNHKASTPVAEVDDPTSGRIVQVLTDQPGLQFYVPKFPAPPPTTATPRRGIAAFCLETQHYPDSPNQPDFPTTVLSVGRSFHSVTTYRFSTIP